MYLVLTRQYARDTSVPTIAPRFLSTDPLKALENARAIARSTEKSEEWDWVEHVTIFSLEEGKPYLIWDTQGTEDNPSKTIVYQAWWDSTAQMHEKFYHGFKDPEVKES